jgi:hypothetical protein
LVARHPNSSVGRRREIVYAARPKAVPNGPAIKPHHRVRHDLVDKAGKITWRYRGEMYSIGIGRTRTGTRVIVLARDLDIRVIDAGTRELLRELTLDTTKRYQGTVCWFRTSRSHVSRHPGLMSRVIPE